MTTLDFRELPGSQKLNTGAQIMLLILFLRIMA